MPTLAPPSSRPAPKPRRWLRTLASIASALVVLGTTTGYAVFHSKLDQIHRIDVFDFGGRPAASAHGSENFLLVGSDSRQGLTRKLIDKYHLGMDIGGQRSDTMILLHVSEQHDRVQLVSLPRDSYVEIPEFTDSSGHLFPAHKAKLNSAYSEGGAALTVRTIEQATGVRIDHYVEINVLGFARMVDALGGVDVCLTKAVSDPKSGLHLAAGKHRVNGTQGLAFVRARHAFGDGSDLGRIKRQQQFLGAMMRRAMSTGILLDPGKLNAFVDAALQSVQVDKGLSPDDMRTLVTAMRHLDPTHVQFLTVPLADTNYDVPGLGSTVLWDPTLSQVLFRALRDDTQLTAAAIKPPTLTVTPGAITVDVRNGTRQHGLAASVSASLAQGGFRVTNVGNADSHDYTVSMVRYGAGAQASAQTVAAAVPGARVVADSSLAPGAVRLVIGGNFTEVAPVKVGAPRTASAATAPKLDTTSAADRTCTQA